MKDLLKKLDWPKDQVNNFGTMNWSKKSIDEEGQPIQYEIQVRHTQSTVIEAIVNLRSSERTRKVFHAQWGASATQDHRLIAWTINRARQEVNDEVALGHFKVFLSEAKSQGFRSEGRQIFSGLADRLSTMRTETMKPGDATPPIPSVLPKAKI